MNARTGATRASASNDLGIGNVGGHAVATAVDKFHAAVAYNDTATDLYLQLHVRANAASNGNAPVACVPIPAGMSASIDYGASGRPIPDGKIIHVVFSSTAATLTAAAAAGFIDITYS